jgi:BASS family bile acid:Na+ symporter
MPFVGFALAKLMNLPPEIAVGHILVGSCPDGTASNVIVYLAHGNVPLSVATTSVTTLIAPLVTPALVWFFARQWVPVDAYGIFISTLQIVILPTVLGITLRKLVPKAVEKSQSVLPLISILAITAVIAAVVALNKSNLAQADANVFIAALLHNSIGLALGYGFASLFRLKTADRRTIAISVGMQNSGLGAALANAHFTALTALPSAIFSVVHNLTGAGLAGYWAKRPTKK